MDLAKRTVYYKMKIGLFKKKKKKSDLLEAVMVSGQEISLN